VRVGRGLKELPARNSGGVGSLDPRCVPGATVDLKNPDYEIFAELRDFGGLVYDTRIPAQGGLPWGTQGRVLSLLSSGIDSPLPLAYDEEGV
jgi:thiamine biosynthesis protein ThiI